MRKQDTISLNRELVNQIISEQGLKRIWLANQIGVDPKTISRWTTGKVTRISRHNALSLAKCLNTTIEEITDKTEIQLDKEFAADQLLTQNLILLLSPTDNWELIETIIKSSISPNLNASKLGRLYNWLSITKWRTQNYTDAKVFASKALDIGKEISDKSMIAKSLFNLGTIYSLTGHNDSALDSYLQAYKLREHIDLTTDFASLCTNLSMVYRDMASFQESIELQKEAIRLFEKDSKHYNLSIAYQCMGFIHTEIGQFDNALKYLDRSIQLAIISNYKSGQAVIPLYKLDALVLSQRFSEVTPNMISCVNDFINGDFYDQFGYEFIARYHRLYKRFNDAEAVIEIGLKDIADNPVAMASLWHEKARLFQDNPDLELLFRTRGNEIYQKHGLPNRISSSKIVEYGEPKVHCVPK